MPRPLPAAVMATKGLAAASNRAIAEEAGVAGGTLHNCFGSHTQLLARAVVHHAASLMGPVAGRPPQLRPGLRLAASGRSPTLERQSRT